MPISSFASQADMIVSPLTPSALPNFMPPPNQIAPIAQLPPAVQAHVALTVSASNPESTKANAPSTPLVLQTQASILDMQQNHVAIFLPDRQVNTVTETAPHDA